MKVTATNRMEFVPPRTGGWFLSFTLALLAHLALLLVLRMGVEWKHQVPPTVTVEAELWSELPQQAAPPAPPLPEEVIPPLPLPTPPSQPQPVAAPIPAPPPAKAIPNPAIAIAKEKARKEKLAKEREAKEAKEAKEAAEQKSAKEKDKKTKDAKDAAALDELIQKKTKAAAAKEKNQKEIEAANSKLANESREKYIKQMMDSNGDASSTGTAKQSSGPSASYAGRIRARIKPNITYTETISGNPVAEVLVHIAADGTILNRKLTKSSGVKSWDNAVLNAIDKTEVLPTDVDGRVQPEMVISFRPKD